MYRGAHAGVGLLPDAEPFPFGRSTRRSRRAEPLDALVAEHACPALPPALQNQRAHLARAVQIVPGAIRRAFADGASLRGTQSGAGEVGAFGGEVAVVECSDVVESCGASGLAVGGAGRGLNHGESM